MAEFIALGKDNYNDAFQLQCLCHSHPWSRATFADSLTAPYFAYSLQQDVHTQGFYLGLQVLEEVTLMDIAVHPDSQGTGVGTRLIKHFLDQCRQREAASIWLEVRVSNRVAIALYEKVGFQVIERRKGYYLLAEGREDALMMKADLKISS